MRICAGEDRDPPKRPVRPFTHSGDENESPQVVEEESVEIERELPVTENTPVERDEQQERPDPPLFEEWADGRRLYVGTRQASIPKERHRGRANLMTAGDSLHGVSVPAPNVVFAL